MGTWATSARRSPWSGPAPSCSALSSSSYPPSLCAPWRGEGGCSETLTMGSRTRLSRKILHRKMPAHLLFLFYSRRINKSKPIQVNFELLKAVCVYNHCVLDLFYKHYIIYL